MTNFPKKKYNIVYADPPWSYRDKRSTHPRLSGGAESHYSTMSLRDICEMPVSSICEDNCMLFLWATFPNLKEALAVIDAWGFKYKTCAFAWVKTNKHNNKPFFGIGYYTKSNVEVVLLGVRGKPFKVSNSVSSVVVHPRTRSMKHSEKPDKVRTRIVSLCGDVPRIELFARKKTIGWDAWGNEL